MSEDTIEQLRQILAETLEDPNIVNSIGYETDLIYDVGLDSLTMINFLLKTEDQFDIEIDYENLDINTLRSFRLFHDYITAHKVS
jgi:acyl carrier protein